MTEQKIIKALLRVAPQVFNCDPKGLGAQRRAEVIAAHLYVVGVVVPTCRCYECKFSAPSRTPNYLTCPRRGGGLVRIDGYCDEAQEKDETKEHQPVVSKATYERVQRAMQERKKAALDPRAYLAPLGYKWENGKLVVNEDAAEVVKRAAEEMARDGKLSPETSDELREAWNKHFNPKKEEKK